MNEFNKMKNAILGFAMILLAVSLAVAVITAERQTAIEMGVSIWQKSFNAHIATTVAILTAIVMAVIVALKKLGLTRWLFAGIPIALIAITFEWASFYAYFEGMGKDYSDRQKSSSISKQALDASFQKLNPASLIVEIDGSGSVDNEKALELNKQSALAERELIKCNNVKGWKTKRACQTKWEANLANSNRQLSGIANLQNETHLKHSERIAEVQALISLRNIAKKEELNQIPYPQFDTIESQSFAFKIAAGAIVFLNLTLFFMGFGLIGFKSLDSENYSEVVTPQSNPRPAPAMATRSNAGSWGDGSQSGWSAMANAARRLFMPRPSNNATSALSPSHSPALPTETLPPEPVRESAGHSESQPELDDENTQPEIDTRRYIGMGFGNIRPNPNYGRPFELTASEDLTASDHSPDTDCVQLDADVCVYPDAVTQTQSVSDAMIETQSDREARIARVVAEAIARRDAVTAQNLTASDIAPDDDCVYSDAISPDAVRLEKTEAQKKAKSERWLAKKGRGKSELFIYEDLVLAVKKDDSLFFRGKISGRKVEKFTNRGREIAKEAIERLKKDGYLNMAGELV
jgi:hypothetical protein